MTTFPITYMVTIIWLIYITWNDTNYWTRFGAKILGSIFGMWISIYTFNGTYWLFVNESTGVFTLSQVKDNFQLPLALIILGLTVILWFMLAQSILNKDWTKTDGST